MIKRLVLLAALLHNLGSLKGSHYLETHQALNWIASQEADGYKEILIIQHEKEQFLDEEEPEPEEETEEEWWDRQPFYEEDLN